MRLPLFRFGLSPLTPLVPKPAAPDPRAEAAAFIARSGKLRRGERLDGDDRDKPDDKDKKPGQLILDAIKRLQEGK
jgi:hypothetical protein